VLKSREESHEWLDNGREESHEQLGRAREESYDHLSSARQSIAAVERLRQRESRQDNGLGGGTRESQPQGRRWMARDEFEGGWRR
jgi:hypothetical protein